MEYNIRVSVKQKKIINTGYELFQTDYGQKLNIIADDLIVTGTTASLILSKADGTIVERTPTLKDGVYSYTLDADDTAVAGKLICNIKYYVEDTSRDSSATFLMNILQDRSGDIVDSQNYSDRIEKALKDVETALDTANEVLDSVDDIATDEATRVSNETARVSAETERATAETARATAEETRVANETARETAETARATAETSRASEYSEIVTACQTATTNANTASAKCDNVKIEENANNNGTTYKLDITDTEGTTITTPNLKGADGTGAGDMAKSVYDTNNKGLDIYDYADSKVATAVKKTDVVNNLTSTDTDKPLSAAMGKSINDKIGTVPENKSLQDRKSVV